MVIDKCCFMGTNSQRDEIGPYRFWVSDYFGVYARSYRIIERRLHGESRSKFWAFALSYAGELLDKQPIGPIAGTDSFAAAIHICREHQAAATDDYH
jgi:hypothetical protein